MMQTSPHGLGEEGARIGGAERGSSLVVVLPLLLLMIVGAATMFQYTSNGMHFASTAGGRQKSFYVADGGLKVAMTRLYADRQTAGTSLVYTATATGALGSGGSYTYTVVQDPLNATDPTRKQVTSSGTMANTTTSLVEQVQVYPFAANTCPSGSGPCSAGTTCTPAPGTCTPASNGSPTCDWAIFADQGTAGLTNGLPAATSLLNGNVHSNNTVTVSTFTGAGVLGAGRFESVGDTYSQAMVTNALSNMQADLFRGGNLVFSAPVGMFADQHVLGIPVLGIHFRNGTLKHGQQQTVSRIGFPTFDWDGWEQSLGVMCTTNATNCIVDADHLPFGTWSSGTWVVSAAQQNFGTGGYLVLGNAHITNVTLARGAMLTVAAKGWLEVDELSDLQVSVGSLLGVSLSSTQTLRLVGKGNVYMGRGINQTAADALNPLSANPTHGIYLTASVATGNRIAAYSETSDVWVKSSLLFGVAPPQLNLVGKHDAVYAVMGSVASVPTTYCQPGLLS